MIHATRDAASTLVETPIGPMVASFAPNGALAELTFARKRPLQPLVSRSSPGSPERMRELVRQLTAYFEGTLREFDFELSPRGSPFQLAVWERLRQIPYGATVSYGEIAADLGDKELARAVGAANGANPIPIVIPCHRVIGSNGKLVGYGGGMDVKRALLDLESGMRTIVFPSGR